MGPNQTIAVGPFLVDKSKWVCRLGDCLPRLRAAAAELRALTGEQGFSTVEQLRLGGDPTDADPTIVICIDPPDEQAMTDLTDLASDPFSGLGAVVVTGPLEPTRVWQLAVTADGLLEVGPLARIVHAQRLPLPLLDAMEQRLQVARSTSDVDTTIPVEDWWPAHADQNLDGQTDHPDQGDTQPDHDTDLLDADTEPPDNTAPTDDDAELELGDRTSETDSDVGGNNAAKRHSEAMVAGPSLRMLDSTDRAQIPVLPPEGCPDGPPDILVQALLDQLANGAVHSQIKFEVSPGPGGHGGFCWVTPLGSGCGRAEPEFVGVVGVWGLLCGRVRRVSDQR